MSGSINNGRRPCLHVMLEKSTGPEYEDVAVARGCSVLSAVLVIEYDTSSALRKIFRRSRDFWKVLSTLPYIAMR